MQHIAGTHLIIDAYVNDEAVLTNQYILSTFDQLIEVLKMEKLGEPVVREVPVNPELLSTEQDEGGVSIIVPITTSHISIHAWPARKAIMMDIFSCHNFNAKDARELLLDKFGISEYSIQSVRRKDPRVEKNRPRDMFMVLERLRELRKSRS